MPQLHVILRDGLDLLVGKVSTHVAHLLVRPLARAEILQLRDEITVMLPGEIGNFHILRDAFGAVAGRALRDEVGEFGIFERRGREERSSTPKPSRKRCLA